MKSDKSEIIIYQTGDGLTKISVRREAMCKNCTFQRNRKAKLKLEKRRLIMNAGWRTVTVGELGRVVTGKTPKTAIAENYGGCIPFLTPSDDMDVKVSTATSKTLTEQGLFEVRNCLLPPRSICVSCIGSDLGKVVMTSQPTVTNQQINSIVPSSDYDADFIYYAMSILGRELNYISKTSTAVPIVNKSAFSSYRIDVPLFSEQQEIGRVLSALDDKIAVNTKINHHLEQMAQAIFKAWFVDFEPWGGERPGDWITRKSEDFFDISIGKTPPRKESQWFTTNPQDVIWVSISDMGNCGMFISDSSEYLTVESIAKFNIKVVPSGTVLLSFKLTVGRVAITDGEMTTNEAIAHFKCSNNMITEYLYCYLKAFDYPLLGSTSSIATAVNSKTIKAMPFVMPDERTLLKFHAFTAPLFEQIRVNLVESARLAALRDSLLPRLMSGELSVAGLAGGK
jgi:type I restriction enzyme S subunit